MAKQIFVSPTLKNEWKIKIVGNQRSSAICSTKAEAIKTAREIAKNKQLEMLVQNLDGTIRMRNSYGNDPRNIQG